ncbi:unnamed protein product, partial [Bubo scandiacus]
FSRIKSSIWAVTYMLFIIIHAHMHASIYVFIFLFIYLNMQSAPDTKHDLFLLLSNVNQPLHQADGELCRAAQKRVSPASA